MDSLTSHDSVPHDADEHTAPVAVFRGTKIARTSDVVTLVKLPATTAATAVEAMTLLASVDGADELGETSEGQYCVLVEHSGLAVAILLSKAQEKAFVRRAYAKSGATGNVPWQALASGKQADYLGSTVTLSPALSRCILEKKTSDAVLVVTKPVTTVKAVKPAEGAVKPVERVKSTAPAKKLKKKKSVQRPRTPSVSSSEDSEEDVDDTEEEVDEESDTDGSISLADYEDEDNDDLIDEDGGCGYTMTVKLNAKTPRAVKLGMKRFAASFE